MALSRQPSQGNRYYVHVAMQAPPVMVGDSTNHLNLRSRLKAIERCLLRNGPIWSQKKRFPVWLSDASTREVEDCLRRDSIQTLVWCAAGHGWEPQQTSKLC